MMKAVIIRKYGSPDVLEYTDIERPKINEHEVLVEVYASSVNPVDWKIRRGMLKSVIGNKFPFILGGDISGRIVKTGDKVKFFRIGDEVFGKLNVFKGGGYAEYAAVLENNIALKPQKLSFEQAATVPLAALTALQALRDIGKITKDKKILINGCSGGVGTFALQIASSYNAEITGICSTRNLDLAKKLGAHNTIDYTEENIINNNELSDVFFDVVGNQSLFKIKKLIKPGGIYITTLPSLTNMFFGDIYNLFSSKKLKKIFVRDSRKDLEFLSELIEDERLCPVIDREFSIKQISEAHKYSETERVTGKILLRIQD